MTCKEAMTTLLKRKNEGVHYHGQMVDYYCFLHLDGLRDLHREHLMEEIEDFTCLKHEFIREFQQLPFYKMEKPSVIPASWENKTCMDITQEDLRALAESSLMSYLDWEENTLMIFEEVYKALVENQNYHCQKYAKKCIKAVREEICDLKELITVSKIYNYDPVYFRNM